MIISTLFLLLVIFQIKHFIADYPLQNSYMLGKFKGGWAWLKPLLAHVSVHGLFTFSISIFFTTWWLAIILAFVDMIIHFCMDRIKASPNLLAKYKALSGNEFGEIVRKKVMFNDAMSKALDNPQGAPGEALKAVAARADYLQESKELLKHNTYFWWSLGFDQLIHHLTDLLVIYIIVTH